MYSIRPNENIGVAGTIQPNAGTAATYLSEAIALGPDTSGRRIMALVLTGTIGASATVDAQLVWSATGGGSYATVAGSAIAQDTTGGNTHQIVVGIDQIVALNPTAKFAKLKVVTAVAATPIAGVVQAFDGTAFPVANAAAAASPTRTSAQINTALA